MNQPTEYPTPDAWRAEATRRFGPNEMKWRFVCPSCGHVAAVEDWKQAGARSIEVAFSCVGRHLEGSKDIFQRPGPCNYVGGGFFRLNPVTVRDGENVATVFAFAEPVVSAVTP